MSLAALCRLKELLGDNPVEVAYYTRRSADWLWSAYHESVMHGSCATFLEFVLPHLMSPPKSDFLNRENEIARLIRVFGARNLRIFSFTNIVEAGHDLFEHFCSTLIPDEPITRVPGGKANPSFAPEMLELLRAMHSLDRRRGQPLNLHLTQAYRRRSKEFDLTSLLATLTQYRKSVDLLPALKELRDVNLSLRRRLAPSIVSPMPEDGLAPEGPTVITYIARDYLLLPGMAEMIQRIRNAL